MSSTTTTLLEQMINNLGENNDSLLLRLGQNNDSAAAGNGNDNANENEQEQPEELQVDEETAKNAKRKAEFAIDALKCISRIKKMDSASQADFLLDPSNEELLKCMTGVKDRIAVDDEEMSESTKETARLVERKALLAAKAAIQAAAQPQPPQAAQGKANGGKAAKKSAANKPLTAKELKKVQSALRKWLNNINVTRAARAQERDAAENGNNNTEDLVALTIGEEDDVQRLSARFVQLFDREATVTNSLLSAQIAQGLCVLQLLKLIGKRRCQKIVQDLFGMQWNTMTRRYFPLVLLVSKYPSIVDAQASMSVLSDTAADLTKYLAVQRDEYNSQLWQTARNMLAQVTPTLRVNVSAAAIESLLKESNRRQSLSADEEKKREDLMEQFCQAHKELLEKREQFAEMPFDTFGSDSDSSDEADSDETEGEDEDEDEDDEENEESAEEDEDDDEEHDEDDDIDDKIPRSRRVRRAPPARIPENMLPGDDGAQNSSPRRSGRRRATKRPVPLTQEAAQARSSRQ